jgi:hypothetical protein
MACSSQRSFTDALYASHPTPPPSPPRNLPSKPLGRYRGSLSAVPTTHTISPPLDQREPIMESDYWVSPSRSHCSHSPTSVNK